MYRHVLVPIAFDQDHLPDAALKVTGEIAAQGARVTLLHVMAEMPLYAISYMPEGYSDNLKRAIQAELSTLAKSFEHGRAVLAEGDPGRVILTWAKDNDVDCIVIASHRPNLGDYLLGSTTTRVVRHALCSVHVLR